MHQVLIKLVLGTVLTSSALWSIPSITIVQLEETGTVIIAEVTSYNSEPGQTDDTPFITASGTHVHIGTIACPYVYEFGTVVRIDGKEYVCEDRMNRKYPDRFDIWLADKEESIAWGIKTMRVFIKK